MSRKDDKAVVENKETEMKKVEATKEATKEATNEETKSSKGKMIALLALSVALAIGAGTGFFFVWRGANYLTTDNARVTTNLIAITANMPGQLERFNLYEGRHVKENEVLGWVENAEALRSPVNGLVIHTNAVQDQVVAPMEPLAVIADTGRIHIQANIEETDILRLQPGQPAIVTIDGLGNRQLSGYISNIGRITQAELTGTALFFNTGGNFTRITHLIPVEVTILDDIDLNNLIGVNARVRFPLRRDGQDGQGESGTFTTTPTQNAGTISTTGVVESTTSRNVYSTLGPLGFKVDQVHVTAGDRVTAGQPLATLDTEDLELTIAQQRAAIETARQTGQVAVADTQRMLQDAETGLAGNTNIHILSAEASLSAAAANLSTIRQNHQTAQRHYQEGTDPQVINAESALRATRIEFENRQRDHANFAALYSGGVISPEEMRQAETALTHARNEYNDARINHENTLEQQRRNLEQLSVALSQASTTHQSAQGILSASRLAAQQEISHLRGTVVTAEAVANLEHMELALAQLERQLENSTITAPISGTVTLVMAQEGEFAHGRLFTVEDTGSLRIITSFREYDLSNIYEGMEVMITSDATGSAVYTGEITRINPAASPFSPVVEFEAEVVVLSADTELRVGLNARVSARS